jgi:ATP-dependent DNA helicase RecG
LRVAFFDDRIEIESPGVLLTGLTVAEMKQGVSQIRNPVIARVFRELDFIEQWGSGIPGVFREASALGLKEPEIREIGSRVRIIVYLGEPLVLTSEQSRKTQAQDGVYDGVHDGSGRLDYLEFLALRLCEG